ncbi:MAG: Fe-S cluster assembly protein SufB [Nanoarchaeota archaeon]|nr:Fe-S cluster assembly protein SufB [Nanoarchaeota archaeon]
MNQEIEINRENYDHYNPENLIFKAEPGITKELVKQISKDKNEPEWMLKKRLLGLKLFNKKSMPSWGPSIDDLDLSKIIYYMKPNAKKNSRSWEDVPEEIRNTYEKLGIPQAERTALGGVGAQYESEVVYHNLKKDLEEKGVIFLDMDEALQKYPEMVEKYFMTNCVSPTLHKFSALHAAVWSGGTFIYVPKNVKIDIPLQAYFRMNAKKGGQFEHTLIIVDEGAEIHYIEGCSAPQYTENSLHAGCVEVYVLKGARARYSSIENWSKNTYNLNTKRAIVHENAIMEWVNGNLGSHLTMLYPCSILVGKNAKTDYIGVAYAGKGQYQDTGCKVYHLAENTSSSILSKGISMHGGTSSYRGLVNIKRGAINSKSNVRCDGLMLDNISKALTFPAMEIDENNVKVAHEATVGKVEEEELFYLMSRGLSEDEAIKLIVSGFIEPLIKALPLEYAVELNRLIELEIENSVC